ncbi:MAG: hypothetical protein Kilf2KO_40690 [Rhodospirillales bacterium]
MAVYSGTSGSNTITGTSESDLISGLSGADVLHGLSGDDFLIGNVNPNTPEANDADARDTLFGGDGDDQLLGQAGDDWMAGGSGSDTLFGGGGRDRLNGSSGSDILEGGKGSDTFFVDTLTDIVREADGEGGVDQVRSIAADYTLSSTPGEDEIERLFIREGAGDADGTGNGRDNRIFGNSGANSLAGAGGDDFINGRSGADTMVGGQGDDTVVVLDATDQVIELAGGGQDLVLSDVDYSLQDWIEDGRARTNAGDVDLNGNTLDNSLQGNSGANSLSGGSGADQLDGRMGADVMVGGSGDDSFWVDDLGDSVVESAGGGSDDRAFIAVDGYTIDANVEIGINQTDGQGRALFSNEDGQSLRGNDGEDRLYGGGGDDRASGGAGDDVIFGGDDDDRVIGGSGSDELYGGAGNDVLGGMVDGAMDILEGEDGDDTLLLQTDDRGYGGSGDDRFEVGGLSAGMIIDGGEGNDIVLLGEGQNLEPGVAVTQVESVSFQGSSGQDVFNGSETADTMTAGEGDDTLEGGQGDDTLDGGSGSDTALFAGSLSDYTLTATTGGLNVVDGSGSDGSDSLIDIEVLQFADTTLDLGAPVQLLDGSTLLGTFSTIQAAVDAAGTGNTISIAEGTYAESVTVDVAVAFVGVGEVVVTPPTGSGFVVDGDLGAANTLSFDGIDIVGAPKSAIDFGTGDVLGSLEVRNARIEANVRNGIEVVDGAGLGNIVIEDSDFAGNGEPDSSSGDGDIILFQYFGDALLRNLTIEGQDRGNGEAENGIQFRGDSGPMGNVTFDNVTITGLFEKQAIGIFNYDHIDNLVMKDVTVTADSTGFNTSINIDGVGGDVDLTDPLRFQNLDVSTTDILSLQGDETANSLTGATEGEFIRGRGGDDDLAGGSGEDILLGQEGDDLIAGDDGDDTASGGLGRDTLTGGTGNDVLQGDEQDIFSLLPSFTTDFSEFNLGPIVDGEEDWIVNSTNRDQEIVDLGGIRGQAFRMSSDPSLGDFAGPFSPAAPQTAGEQQTSADANTIRISYDFKAVSDTPDSSRIEVDFGIDAATDRNNFMVLEWDSTVGLRIAVNEPNSEGGFGPGDFSAFSGNRTLIEGVDLGGAEWHNLEMILRFEDGPDNDVIDFFLDGQHIGSSTTFENFRNAINEDGHAANAEANITSRLFFRPSGGGAPEDGPEGDNQGFYFDNVAIAAYDSGAAHADSLDGGDGDDTLMGQIGDDSLAGGSGADSLEGGEGHDTLNGGEGNDVQSGGIGDDRLIGGSGDDSLSGGPGDDVAVFEGDFANATLGTSGSGDLLVTTGPGGTDSLTGIQRLEFDDQTILVVGEGGFETIQAAVDAATVGDTILVSSGLYEEVVTVDKQVTILGAQAGVDGDDAGRGTGESIVDGGFWIQANGVTLNGLMVQDGAKIAGSDTGVYVTGDDATITAMLFERSGGFDGFRGIITPTNSDESGLSVTASKFTGWATGVYSDGDSDFDISGNVFEANNVGISSDFPTLPASVDANDFTANVFEDYGLAIRDQSFDLGDIVGDANSFSGGVPQVSAYAFAETGVQTITGSNANDQIQIVSASAVEFSGEAGDDVLMGGAANDILRGGEGDDTLEGGGGIDFLFAGGGSGDDHLTGGSGGDSFRFESNEGTATISDFDIVEFGEVIGVEIGINGTDISEFSDLAGRITESGGNLIVDLSNRPSDDGTDVDFKVVVEGIADTALIGSDDFIFFV